MNDSPSNLFPALRAKMGDRWYYVTTLTLGEVDQWVKPVDKIHERKEFKTWIQRQLVDERKEEIATYLLNQEQRFFNAIVVGIYRGEPEWFPVEVGESATLKEIKLGERQATAFGLLRLSGDVDIFAIDGQHRVEGIREALLRSEALKDEELTVIFVAHKTTDEGRERTRRLFTTLNKYAKPVSRAELIALNDDDTFAIVTRRLIESYRGLQSEFVPLASTANIPTGNQTSITTVIALYELVKTITVPSGSRERKLLEQGPPNWTRVDEIYCTATSFWDALKAHVTAIRKVCTSSPHKNLAGKYRTEEGGHLLFRPAGLQGFARAARVMVDRGEMLQTSVAKLARVSLQLSTKPWVGVLWNPSTKTMIVKNKKLVPNLFLYMVGENLVPDNYDLLAQYRRATGVENARLPRPKDFRSSLNRR
jgi:DNA sulfur modification protein DndB